MGLEDLSLEDLLSRIHRQTAEEMLEILDSEEGPTAAQLNVIRQFLKDNHMDEAVSNETPVFKLAERLPFRDPDLKKAD